MKIRTWITAGALLLATALPSVGAAQRYRSYGSRPYYGRTSYGHGPFYPSYIPAPSARYFGAGVPYRSGGATFYFGTGGGYYGDYGYGYAPAYRRPYRHARSGYYHRHRF